MISFMETHPDAFKEAIELAVSDKQPYSWRAAWLLWSCMVENDQRIQSSIGKIMNAITTKKDDHQRELIKMLLHMELNEKHEGFLFNLCISIWEKISKKPSVRYTAFKFIVKMAKKYPELADEIKLLLQNQYLDPLSPAAKKSIDKMLNSIK